ncbi:hypothetical protein MPER_05237, partial [Moniliophthora perniciosa FA553]
YLPEVDSSGKEKWPRGDEKVWKEGMRGVDGDVKSIAKSFVNHAQTSLARQAYNLDDFGAYQATALSVRDSLLLRSNVLIHVGIKVNLERNPTSLYQEIPKASVLSFPRLLNLGLKDQYKEGVDKLGFNMEDLLGQERDAALGN